MVTHALTAILSIIRIRARRRVREKERANHQGDHRLQVARRMVVPMVG